MISAVAEQNRMFSARNIQAADDARALYRKIGRPDEATFQMILHQAQINNCHARRPDNNAWRALIIYGPDINVKEPAAAPRVPAFTAVPFPAPIAKYYLKVTLCVDFLYVQGLPFLVPSRGTSAIIRPSLQLTIDRTAPSWPRPPNPPPYAARGLEICDKHANGEFDCMCVDLLLIVLHIVAPDAQGASALLLVCTGFLSHAFPT
jgi:hypothetical protein